MCGIAGIVSLQGTAGAEAVRAMTARLVHRGPDADGLWSDGSCALGHRRLSIIDLSDAGRQPMSNDDESVWITFNGEIYNFRSLRADLQGLGHAFRTRTDTEVILRAYDQWGDGCIRRLRGMFAFALWDRPRRRLLLARDRVGKKPLFYAWVGDRFVFASELQALLALPDVPREVDWQAVDSYLSWGYVPAPHTAFKGIRKLLPGHSLDVDFSKDAPLARETSYWHLEYSPKLALSESEAIEALRERLTEAVRLRMISDVPLGAFLSGGIDSSIVVGLMAGLSDRPVKTFSIGFKEAAFNELDHARRVAERWSTSHTECVVEPDALAILPGLVRHFGEPYADSSAIPTYYVSKITRERVTVALNGDGGDESFAGYDRYLANAVAERLRRIPLTTASARALGRLLPDSPHQKSTARRIHRFLEVAGEPMAARYGRWLGYFAEAEKRRLYAGDLRATLSGPRPDDWLEGLFDDARLLHPVEAAMSVDVRSYLPYDLLVKVDITSMAHGLEARSPFLDHEVMELAASLPVSLKRRGRESKYLLKRAFADLLPAANVDRPKMGFGVPVGDWFRGPLRELLEDALLSEQARRRGIFASTALRTLVADHIEGRAEHSNRLWSLLMLELWLREFGL